VNVLESVLSLSFVAAMCRISIPYIFATVGGIIAERSGTIDIALEAKLLWGAFAAATVSHATGSVTVGIVAAAIAGALVAVIQGICTVLLRADQVIIGVGLNLTAFAGTRFLLQRWYGQGANSPSCPDIGDTVLGNPLFYGAIIAVALASIGLFRTVWGLRLRAAGERPSMVHHAGLSVRNIRFVGLVVGGAIVGLGGAQLSLAVGGFFADTSNGRGYLALAAVILSSWRPVRGMFICFAFAAAEALNILLQNSASLIPRELAPTLPYLLALIVICILGAKTKAPASLGK
jgi:general nucleoside transport system permease protein